MREVIVLAKGGDREALGRCLEICRNYLLEVARLRLPSSLTDRLGASDLVQDVYLACCTAEKFREFRGETEEELLAVDPPGLAQPPRERASKAYKTQARRESRGRDRRGRRTRMSADRRRVSFDLAER